MTDVRIRSATAADVEAAAALIILTPGGLLDLLGDRRAAGIRFYEREGFVTIAERRGPVSSRPSGLRLEAYGAWSVASDQLPASRD